MEDAGATSKIRDFSETSVDEDDGTTTHHEGAGERKQSTTITTSESIEEGPDYSTRRSKADEEYADDIAQQKRERRARAQPGAKRGGRRDTGRSSWGRLLGRKKVEFEAGDLVEAEWARSGWWYVGYVSGECMDGEESSDGAKRKAGRRTKDEFHVIFADGDEADVRGRDLKPLRTTDKRGQPTGNTDTALPQHVPVADLGSGRLHGSPKPHLNQNSGTRGRGERHRSKKKSGKKRTSKSSTEGGDGVDSQEEKSEAVGGPLPQGANVGDIEKRLRQGESAVWGGRGAPDGSSVHGSQSSRGSGSGDWWETRTRYAFQPRLAADKATVLSLVDTGSRRDGGVDSHRGGVGGSQVGSRAHSVAAGLTLPHQQQQLQEGHGSSRELVRIVNAPVSNADHGKRIFFLA